MLGDACPLVGLGALAASGPAPIVGDHAPKPRQFLDSVGKAERRASAAVDEDDRCAPAVLLVVEADAVYHLLRHQRTPSAAAAFCRAARVKTST